MVIADVQSLQQNCAVIATPGMAVSYAVPDECYYWRS
jgi:hypothetical protein